MSNHISPIDNKRLDRPWEPPSDVPDGRYTILEADEAEPVDTLGRGAIKKMKEETPLEDPCDLEEMEFDDELIGDLEIQEHANQINVPTAELFAAVNSENVESILAEIGRRYPELLEDCDSVDEFGKIDYAKKKWEEGLQVGRTCLLAILMSKSPQLRHCKTLEEALKNKEAILTINQIEIPLKRASSGFCLPPPEIGELTNLKHLRFWGNNLLELRPELLKLKNLERLEFEFFGNSSIEFPSWIGQLANLKSFLCYSDNALHLPFEFSNLKGLETLHLTYLAQPFTLPSWIGNLTQLKELHLRCRLQEFPLEIGNLRNLEHLNIMAVTEDDFPLKGLEKLSNLRSLCLDLKRSSSQFPMEIASLRSLESLRIEYIDELPCWVCQLPNLQELDLSDNHALTHLPVEILNLPANCEVELSGCGLSDEVLLRLRQACAVPGYQGPRFSYSMREGEFEEKPAEEILRSLFSELKQPYEELTHLLGEEANQVTLRTWLNKLAYMKDFQGTAETKHLLVANIVRYLRLANENPQFRQIFSLTIQEGTATCGDRVALSIIRLDIQYQLMKIDIKDVKKLANFLARGVWAMSLLENLARIKTETLSFFDEIEVYLAYPAMLKERLGLPIAIEEMLHFTCSGVTNKDLEAAAKFVEGKLNNQTELCQFLISQDKWHDALKAHFPDGYAQLEGSRNEGLAAEDPDYEAIDKAWKEGLIKLTKTKKALEE